MSGRDFLDQLNRTEEKVDEAAVDEELRQVSRQTIILIVFVEGKMLWFYLCLFICLFASLIIKVIDIRQILIKPLFRGGA